MLLYVCSVCMVLFVCDCVYMCVWVCVSCGVRVYVFVVCVYACAWCVCL